MQGKMAGTYLPRVDEWFCFRADVAVQAIRMMMIHATIVAATAAQQVPVTVRFQYQNDEYKENKQ